MVLVLILGIIGSFILGNALPAVSISSYSSRVYEEYNWGLAIGGVVGSIIFGTFLLGIGELIQLCANNLEEAKAIHNHLLAGEVKQDKQEDDELPDL